METNIRPENTIKIGKMSIENVTCPLKQNPCGLSIAMLKNESGEGIQVTKKIAIEILALFGGFLGGHIPVDELDDELQALFDNNF